MKYHCYRKRCIDGKTHNLSIRIKYPNGVRGDRWCQKCGRSPQRVQPQIAVAIQVDSRVSGEGAKGVKYAAIINVKVLKEAGLLSAWLKSVKLGRVAIVNSMYEPSSKMY